MTSYLFQEVMDQRPQPIFFGVTVSEKTWTTLEVLARIAHIVLSSVFVLTIFLFEFSGIEILLGALLSVFIGYRLSRQNKNYNAELERWEAEVVYRYYATYPLQKVSDSIIDFEFYDMYALSEEGTYDYAGGISLFFSGEEITLEEINVHISNVHEKPMFTYRLIPADLNPRGEDLFYLPTLVISKADIDYIVEYSNKTVMEILKEKDQTVAKAIEDW